MLGLSLRLMSPFLSAEKPKIRSFQRLTNYKKTRRVPLALASPKQLVNLAADPKLTVQVRSEILTRKLSSSDINEWRVEDLVNLARGRLRGDLEITDFVSDKVLRMDTGVLHDAKISDLVILTRCIRSDVREKVIDALRHHHHLLTADELEALSLRL